MRKGLMGMAAIGMMALTGVAHAEDKKVTIGVSIPAADHGWTAGVVFHAERVAKLLMAQHPGLNIIVKTSPDPATQANAVQDLATQGIDALVILPSDPDPLVNAIKEVKDAGKFVAIVDRAPSVNDNSVRDLYIAGNNPALGETAGKYIAANTPACRSRSTSSARMVSTRALPAPTSRFSIASSATGTATMPSRSCRTT
jgi:ribose transport system substrate-binding protein